MGVPAVEHCTKADFDEILESLDCFWEGSPGQFLHNPVLLTEFPDSAYVIREGGQVAAYLFGLVGQGKPKRGYVQLVATRRQRRRGHLARTLYEHFETYARSMGCRELKAVTALDNANSIAFHSKIGMTKNIIKDYAGRGVDRVVFIKPL